MELSPRAPRVQSLLPRFLYSHCHVERRRYSLSVRLLSARGWHYWSFQTKPGSTSWSWGSQITTARCKIIMDWNVWKRLQLWPIKQQKRKLEEVCVNLFLKRIMLRLNLVFFIKFFPILAVKLNVSQEILWKNHSLSSFIHYKQLFLSVVRNKGDRQTHIAIMNPFYWFLFISTVSFIWCVIWMSLRCFKW